MMNLSIIGLHASFADAQNIDRFERFIYQGAASGAMEKDTWYNACKNSVEQLAQQQGLAPSELVAIVVSSRVNESEQARLKKHLKELHCVNDLSEALTLATSHDLAAIIGVQIDDQAEQAPSENTLSIADGFNGYVASSGSAALLLANKAYCRRNHAYVYASIEGFVSAKSIVDSCQQALKMAKCDSADIQYLELSALAETHLQEQESQALCQVYTSENSLQTALGSVRSVVGEGGCFAQVAGLLKTALVLHQRYYPAIKDWQKPTDSIWQSSAFYMPTESRPWFEKKQHIAKAAFSCQSATHYCHIILQENSSEKERNNGYLACSDLVMLPLTANTEQSLLAQLEALKAQLNKKTLREIASDSYQAFSKNKAIFTACLLAESTEELAKEIQLAEQGIAQAFASNLDWKTPKGSYFSPEPTGDNAGITFLYPGIGATYVGLGRDIFHLFPEIYQPVAALADDIGASLKDTTLNPRSIERLGFHDIKALDHTLRNDLAEIAEAGVGFACVFTKIFEEVFQLKASYATGYSMGEISMYAALGCWEKPGAMSKRLAESDTFNHCLTGELKTLRQHWDLPPAKKGQVEQLWETYTLKATVEEIAEAAADEDKVYCTIVNTPDSLVIGGDPAACQRVIKKLGVRAMALDMANAIHSPPAFKEYRNMEELFSMDVSKRIDTKLYSSSCYLPVPQRSKAIANSIAKCLCDPVDFPRLVNAMYDKGARVFIEMGPGRSLCSWVEKTLKHEADKAHVSVPVNAKGTSDELTLMRAVAKLISHGITMDITTLYQGSLLVLQKQHGLNDKAM